MAKALAHPLRVQLLTALNEGVASPNELAKRLNEPLTNVSYHVRMLHDLGCIELVETEPRRGALEHYYRAIVRPFFADRDWKKLPKNTRGSISDTVLGLVWDDTADAIKSGIFDERENRHLSRSVLCMDEKGWEDMNDLLSETLDRAMQIQADSAGRRDQGRGRHVLGDHGDDELPDAEVREGQHRAELGHEEEAELRRRRPPRRPDQRPEQDSNLRPTP